MNHINLEEDVVKSLISEARWDKVGIVPAQEKSDAEIVEESTDSTDSTEEVIEEDEELTLEDLEALLEVFPDNVLQEHAISMAEVLNEAYEEQNKDLVSEESDEPDDSDLIASIVRKTLADLDSKEE